MRRAGVIDAKQESSEPHALHAEQNGDERYEQAYPGKQRDRNELVMI
jgi:hypothetical protein